MRLVDRHEEGQGNPRVEVAIDSQRAYVMLGLANYYHHHSIQDFVFSKVATTLSDLLENGYPKSGMSLSLSL